MCLDCLSVAAFWLVCVCLLRRKLGWYRVLQWLFAQGTAIWLSPLATILFNVCSAVTVECCVLIILLGLRCLQSSCFFFGSFCMLCGRVRACNCYAYYTLVYSVCLPSEWCLWKLYWQCVCWWVLSSERAPSLQVCCNLSISTSYRAFVFVGYREYRLGCVWLSDLYLSWHRPFLWGAVPAIQRVRMAYLP